MDLGDNRAIKTGQWFPNEIFRDDDINVVGEATYQNITDQLAIRYKDDLSTGRNAVVKGLNLVWNNLLTTDLQIGSVLSPKGTYLASDVWGFLANPDGVFLTMVPVSAAVAFNTGGTNDRIDSVEIRPIEVEYNAVSRNFKDPVTGLISTAIAKTRKEYGYEFAVREGDDTAALSRGNWTWTVNTATVGSDLDGSYVLFGTPYADYYAWFDTGSSVDPAVADRTGIQVSISAGASAASIANSLRNACRTFIGSDEKIAQFDLSGDTVRGLISWYGTTSVPTNGDTGAFFDAIIITSAGNGPPIETEGWVKIAEVHIPASASAITQDDIYSADRSYGWHTTNLGTVPVAFGRSWVPKDYSDGSLVFGKSSFFIGNALIDDEDLFAAVTSGDFEVPPVYEKASWEPVLSRKYGPGDKLAVDSILSYSGNALINLGQVGLPAFALGGAVAAMTETRVAVFESTSGKLQAYDWEDGQWVAVGSLSATITTTLGSIDAMGEDGVAVMDRTTLYHYTFNGSTWALNDSIALSIGTPDGAPQVKAMSETLAFVASAGSDIIQGYWYTAGTWKIADYKLEVQYDSISAIECVGEKYLIFVTGSVDRLTVYKFDPSIIEFSVFEGESLNVGFSYVGDKILTSFGNYPILADINDTDFMFWERDNDEIEIYRIKKDGGEPFTLLSTHPLSQGTATYYDLEPMKNTGRVAWINNLDDALVMYRFASELYSEKTDYPPTPAGVPADGILAENIGVGIG